MILMCMMWTVLDQSWNWLTVHTVLAMVPVARALLLTATAHVHMEI